MAPSEAECIERLSGVFRGHGFDLFHPFSVTEQLDPLGYLPRFDRAASLGVLVGNTRALWQPFLDWRRRHVDVPDPLDRYTEEITSAALRALNASAGIPRHRIFYTHGLYASAASPNDGPRPLPFQRLGAEAGFASLGPAHLSARPVEGPWFAYRALIVLDVPTSQRASTASAPCAGCAAPCAAALQTALSTSGARVRDTWQAWLGVRTSCPIGREYTYSERQIEYHYTHDVRALRKTARSPTDE